MPQLTEGIYHNPAAASWTCPSTTPTDRIRRFHSLLPEYGVTPLVSCPSVASRLRIKDVYIKDESSRLGLPAFKILGASWASYKAVKDRLALESETLDLNELKALIIEQCPNLTFFAATDGNHGRAIARMARLLHARGIIYVPEYLDDYTIDLIRGECADVVTASGDYDNAVQLAHEESKRFGPNGLYIQDTAFEGYEEIPRWIVQGYSTMLLEADEQLVRLGGTSFDTIVVPVGVGSLAMAVVAHYKNKQSKTKIIAVEPESADCLFAALRENRSRPVSTQATIMSGMNCGTLSTIAWPLLRQGVDLSVRVSDQEVHTALLDLDGCGIKVGPCGSAPLAALLHLNSVGAGTFEILNETSTVLLLCTEGPRTYCMVGQASSGA